LSRNGITRPRYLHGLQCSRLIASRLMADFEQWRSPLIPGTREAYQPCQWVCGHYQYRWTACVRNWRMAAKMAGLDHLGIPHGQCKCLSVRDSPTLYQLSEEVAGNAGMGVEVLLCGLRLAPAFGVAPLQQH
jgi:hypothetical protein